MVIDDANFGLGEGVKNGAVELDEGLIFPKGRWAGGIEAEPAGDFGQEVVAVFVSEISCPNFCFHIPTAEWGGRKADSSDFQPHVGDNGKGDPPKVKGVEAGRGRMLDGNLEGHFFWRWKETGFFARQGDDDGKKVKGGSFFRRFPSKVKAEVSEFGFGWIPENLFFVDSISGVAAELVVPYAGAMASGVGGGEDCDGRTNFPVMSRMAEMMKATLVNLLFSAGVAGVENVELRPEKATDAADAVSPSEAAAIAEFWECEGVGSSFLDGLGDLAKTGLGGSGSTFFGLEKSEKGVGRLRQRKRFFSSGEAETLGYRKKRAGGHWKKPTPSSGYVKSISQIEIFAFVNPVSCENRSLHGGDIHGFDCGRRRERTCPGVEVCPRSTDSKNMVCARKCRDSQGGE